MGLGSLKWTSGALEVAKEMHLSPASSMLQSLLSRMLFWETWLRCFLVSARKLCNITDFLTNYDLKELS